MDRKEEFLKPGERLDDLQNGYWMIQNPSLFCYGIDAVLLASYAKVKRGERAMDFCTGSGIVPILLKAKTNGEHFFGLEIQEYSAEMAQRSVRYNHLENDVEIFQGDVKTAYEITSCLVGSEMCIRDRLWNGLRSVPACRRNCSSATAS